MQRSSYAAGVVFLSSGYEFDRRERRRADEFQVDRAGATFSIGPQSRQE